MNNKQCYLCKGKTEVLYNFNRRKKGSYKLLKCQSCSFLRINPIPDQSILDKLYKNQAMPKAQLENEVFSSSFLTLIKKKILIEPLLAKLNNFFDTTDNTTLLDIGCSTGWITSVAGEIGFKVKGIEANSHVAEYARTKYGIDVIEGYIEELDTKQKYNAFTMFHVLEHIADPRKMLTQINSLLEEKGKLLIVVPNSKSLGVSIFKRNYNWNIPHHISFFNPITIKEILDQSGFRILGVDQLNSPPLMLYSFNKYMKKRKREGKFSFKINNWIISNALFVPLSFIGKILGRGEVIAVYGEKV